MGNETNQPKKKAKKPKQILKLSIILKLSVGVLPLESTP